MILKPSYLRAPADTTVSTPAAQVAVPREPSATELAIEFVADPSFLSDPDSQASVDKSTIVAAEKSIEEKKAESIKPVVEINKEEVKPIVSAAPKTEAKPESKKSVDTKPVVQAGDVIPILPVAAKPKERDYSGFSEAEVGVLKAMSNEAFEHTSKIIKENKELSKLKDASYLQHPLAYTLSPEYTKLQEDAYYLNAEGQYWQQQLAEIAEGNEWAPIVGWNKDGSPALGAKQKATSIAAEQIRVAMGQCFNKAANVSEQVQQFSGRYKQQIDYDTNVIQQECARRFGWVADPKLLDEKIAIKGVGDRTVRQVREDFISLFPSYHQNSIGIQIAAHMWAGFNIQAQRIHELENSKQVAVVKEEEKSLIEPSSKETPTPTKASNGSGGNPGIWAKEFSMEGMPV